MAHSRTKGRPKLAADADVLVVAAGRPEMVRGDWVKDGATVIDSGGHFRSCKVLLRPAAETRAEIGPDKGARHSSAAKMSAEARCLAITVSQDGPITAYDKGKLIFSL